MTTVHGAATVYQGLTVLDAHDIFHTLDQIQETVVTTILDPWYNKGEGGYRSDYDEWLTRVIARTAEISQHIFVWGFPEIVHRQLDRLPLGLSLVAWLTWYYKNCPSVIRGWRSAQLACLHLAHQGAKLYPEHFLTYEQSQKREQKKLRYVPGPPSVLEAPLLVGFVGKNEQTGHPAQKPTAVIKPLILMTTMEGDLVLDPMCGSGTTGVVCTELRRRAILCDSDPHWVEVTSQRLAAEERRNGR